MGANVLDMEKGEERKKDSGGWLDSPTMPLLSPSPPRSLLVKQNIGRSANLDPEVTTSIEVDHRVLATSDGAGR